MMPNNTTRYHFLSEKHEVVLDEKSVIEFLICCILTITLRIDQNTKDKENPDNSEHN